MYLHVFWQMALCSCRPCPFAWPRSLARWRVVATVCLRAGARSPRCRYGNFVVLAAQVQANNQQIYLDQALLTGQQQQGATWTAANLLLVEVPCRCWLPVVYLEATEKQYWWAENKIPVDWFDSHSWESDLKFLDPPTHRTWNPSTENQCKRLLRNWNNLNMAKHSISTGLKVKMWNR